MIAKQGFAAIIVIAANAGGAWSVIGDVTTTML
jgi:Na+/H+ antiporter NhaD/arsenite permease-like protein